MERDIPEMFERCTKLIAERRENPTDDLTSVLVHAAVLATIELGMPLSGQAERVRREVLPVWSEVAVQAGKVSA